MILLVDVSSWQGAIDWQRVRQAGITGAFVKATEANAYVNRKLHAQVEGARAAGLRVGLYHFARPDSPASASGEAEHFCRNAAALATRRDLRPVLDFETWGDTLHPTQMVVWARQWNAHVRSALGVGPLFYSYPAFVQRLAPRTPIGYGLWLAAYSRNDGHEHPFVVPAPWRRAVAHQFTSRGAVPGIGGPVDLSSARSLWPLLAHPVKGAV